MLKERRPLTYVLNMLRHSARKRNLPFTLTASEFKKFCENTGYLERRGSGLDDLTVDRIDRDEGYHLWNMRVLTHRENSAQGAENTPRAARADGETEAITDYCEPADPENEPF